MEVPMSSEDERIVVLTPTAGSVYAFGWSRMKKLFLDLFLITVIFAVVLIPLGMITSLDGENTPGGVLLRMFSFGYLILLFFPIDYGAAWVFLKAVRNEKFDVQDMFSVFENYINVILAQLLVWAIVGIGLVLFVVPGIVLLCRLAFVRYLVMDRKMEPVEAVKESWRMTQPHSLQIFLMGLLTLPIFTAGAICFVVGLIPALMWVRCAFASMYYAASELEKPQSQTAEPAPAETV
jgi:uncharacterized membrane protein